MSEHEFDTYLDQLTGALPLDAAKRDTIARELRTHLEDRLDELTRAGVEHNEAVCRALEEFGDGRTLAHNLGRAARRRRGGTVRRAVLVAASMALVAGLVSALVPFGAGSGATTATAEPEPPMSTPATMDAQPAPLDKAAVLEGAIALLDQQIEMQQQRIEAVRQNPADFSRDAEENYTRYLGELEATRAQLQSLYWSHVLRC